MGYLTDYLLVYRIYNIDIKYAMMLIAAILVARVKDSEGPIQRPCAPLRTQTIGHVHDRDDHKVITLYQYYTQPIHTSNIDRSSRSDTTRILYIYAILLSLPTTNSCARSFALVLTDTSFPGPSYRRWWVNNQALESCR